MQITWISMLICFWLNLRARFFLRGLTLKKLHLPWKRRSPPKWGRRAKRDVPPSKEKESNNARVRAQAWAIEYFWALASLSGVTYFTSSLLGSSKYCPICKGFSKRKNVVNELTTNEDGVVLCRSMELEQLDHYVNHLLFYGTWEVARCHMWVQEFIGYSRLLDVSGMLILLCTFFFVITRYLWYLTSPHLNFSNATTL